MKIDDLVKINDWLWEIPKSFRGDMRVPARIYANQELLPEILHDHSLEQLINVATLPGILDYAFAMPDIHEGYGFPIGGVAATLLPEGIISPGGIGYDINCGVRLIKSELTYEEIKKHIDTLAAILYSEIPSGVGKGGRLKLNNQDLDAILKKGARGMVEKGYGNREDLLQIESKGELELAAPHLVSPHAKERGRDQIGTLGAGNHFIEVDWVEKIYSMPDAEKFGLFPNQIVILIHTGSRGLGHQVATDYIKTMIKAMGKYNLSFPDIELAGAPYSCEEGYNYFQAMSAAANFAWANRQMIAWEAEEAWKKALGKNSGKLTLLHDVAHNIAKIEERNGRKVLVHRKGATRAFKDQPVIIPGSMGTASYVLMGKGGEAFSSTCHGAGRRMSRHAAQKKVDFSQLMTDLQSKGIVVKTASKRGLTEEAPLAYKDIDAVVDVVDSAGLAAKVARLKPLIVVKG